MSPEQIIQRLFGSFFPTGRAWNSYTDNGFSSKEKGVFVDGLSNQFVDGLGNVFTDGFKQAEDVNKIYIQSRLKSYARFYEDMKSLFNIILPDNENFDEQDAENWERVYGIIPSEGATLEERVSVIRQRYSYPNGVLERSTAEFMQEQLRAAGFDVYVHENRFLVPSRKVQLGSSRLGKAQLGGTISFSGRFAPKEPDPGYTEIVANYIDETLDQNIYNGFPGTQLGKAQLGRSQLRSTIQPDRNAQLVNMIFVSGENYPDLADVPENRKDELRQLELTLKPLHSTILNYINYTS